MRLSSKISQLLNNKGSKLAFGTKGIYLREQIKAELSIFAAAFQVSASGLQEKNAGFDTTLSAQASPAQLHGGVCSPPPGATGSTGAEGPRPAPAWQTPV